MTIRKIAYALLIGSVAGLFAGCNSTVESVEQTATNAAIKSFNIVTDTEKVSTLDSVFFSIDLVKGQIFNADSLPVGTKVSALIPKIVTYDAVSVAELTVKRAGLADTTINYLRNSNDSVDFTNPVNLRIVSYDGLVERNYTIKVNVHQTKADSLAWGTNDRTALPSSFAIPAQQRTVRMGDSFYCLTRSNSNYCLASYTHGVNSLNSGMPRPSDWTLNSVSFNFTPNLNSFAANKSMLFILDTDGNLYSSADGLSWDSTGLVWNSIYGGYGDTLLGAVNTPAGWKIQQWPSAAMVAVPSGMPVSGASVPVEYSFEMSDSPQMLIVGGRCADGSLCRDTWGYDGSSWLKISVASLPKGFEGMAVARYFSLKENSVWNVTEQPSLLAFGGRDADGVINKTVYLSNDYGYHWSEAPLQLQLPETMAATYDAQAYVMTSLLSGQLYVPKVSSSHVEWECPYIYMFGGINSSNTLQNTVWRGFIRKFSYTPVL